MKHLMKKLFKLFALATVCISITSISNVAEAITLRIYSDPGIDLEIAHKKQGLAIVNEHFLQEHGYKRSSFSYSYGLTDIKAILLAESETELDAKGRIISEKIFGLSGGGVNFTILTKKVLWSRDFEYDNSDRLTMIVNHKKKRKKVFEYVTISYGRDGRVEKHESFDKKGKLKGSRIFQYDNSGRLVKSDVLNSKGKLRYHIEPVAFNDKGQITAERVIIAQKRKNANKVVVSPEITYLYDAGGRIIRRGYKDGITEEYWEFSY